MSNKPTLSLMPGQNYCFESVTSNLYVGRLESIEGPHTVVLSDAAWISETGRLNEFMRTGRSSGMEVEPVGIQAVHWAGWRPWPFELFKEVI